MKIHHLMPPPLPLVPPARPKPMPSAFDVALQTEQLREEAEKQRLQRVKRDKMFADRKKAAQEKGAGTDAQANDDAAANPQDSAFDLLA